MTEGLRIRCDRPWLIIDFAAPQRMVSWSLNRPGFVDADKVAWLEVQTADFLSGIEPADWFHDRLQTVGHRQAVGMMTARDVSSFVHRTSVVGDIEAQCVATVGLNNGEYVGRRTAVSHAGAGTINILCHVSSPLTDAGLLEAASIVAQARTVALSRIGYRRPGSAVPVTGTGTDCIVMAAPLGPQATPYAGMHTAIGEAVGACVLDAVELAATAWIRSRAACP